MDGGQERLSPSIERRLALALTLGIAFVALLAGAFSFAAAYDEARELQDDMLRQVALLAAAGRIAPAPPAADAHFEAHDDAARIVVQRLGEANPQGLPVDQGGALALVPTLADGLHTLELGGESFRVLVRTGAGGARIAVAQESDFRDELALGSAQRTLLPFLVLVPILLLLVVYLVRTMFRPIAALAREVDARRDEDLRPMAAGALPAELRPFVAAINRLLARVAQVLAGERRFVADAAHELRSPLAALSLQAERLGQTKLNDAARERLAALRQGIERGRRLVEQLLALARAQAAAGDVSAAPAQAVSLQRIIREVLEEAMPLADARHIDIGVESPEDARVQAAERDLFTLVRNLVDNALRYTPVGGRVDLAVRRLGAGAQLCVRDSGPGIAPAERERVFDAFYRLPGSDETGSGLGLAIVRATAERIGARIDLRYADEAQQAGTMVTVVFR